MAASALRTVQLGRETVWGTPVPATTKLMGVTDASLQYTQEVEQSEELGTLAPSIMTSLNGAAGEASISADLSYSDLSFYAHGLFGIVAATGVGPYTYAYLAPLGAPSIPQVFSIEFGPPTAIYVGEGAVLRTLTISGEVGSLWKAESDWLLEDVNVLGGLAALSDRVVTPIRMVETTVAIDLEGGTMGATVFAASVKSFSLTVNTNRHTKYFAGAMQPGAFGEDRWDGELTLRLEYNSTVKTLVDTMMAGTGALLKKLIRVFGFATTQSAQINFAGHLAPAPKFFDDEDGNVVIELTFVGGYNTVLANWLTMVVVNSLAAMP